jgi:putative oxidoreductase
MLRKLLATDNDLAPLVMRLILGIVFFPHGAQKALGLFGGHGLSATLDFFTQQMGLPLIAAVLVVAAEFLGSIGLVLGLFTRVAALGILAVMAGAVYLVHWQNGFFMNWMGSQQGEGIEYHLLAMALALALILRGGGLASVDRAICCN